MEFSETAKANAIKFLEELVKKTKPPGSSDGTDETVPIKPNHPRLRACELEAECLDMTKNYLARLCCPGILSYHISAEVYSRLSGSMDTFLANEDVNGGSDSSEQLYDSIVMVRGLLSVIYSVCEEWGKELPLLTAPVDKVELSLFAIKNSRRKMEDRHAVCVDVNSLYGLKGFPHQAYYAVFDGHIGVEAASYASVHLLTNIVRASTFQDDPRTALKDAIKTTDDNFCIKNLPRSGTTAVACLIRGDKVYAGWVGDSQAMLVQSGKPTQLVEPHKPDQEGEQQRIEEAGGLVIWNGAWRVNGNLSVSRAIGDAPDKKFVIGDGDVSTLDLNGSDDYLMVACDGVWDVLSMEEIVECVGGHLASPGGSKQSVAKAIIQLARSEGSGDNMTVIVSFFSSFKMDTPPVEVTTDESPSCPPPSETKDSTVGESPSCPPSDETKDSTEGKSPDPTPS